jgi:hypothetical protein
MVQLLVYSSWYQRAPLEDVAAFVEAHTACVGQGDVVYASYALFQAALKACWGASQ